MFLSLLIVTFIIAFGVSFIVVKLFDASVEKILARIIRDDISLAWNRYLKFAIIVVGISGGVRVWELEQYIRPRRVDEAAMILTAERWVLEVYRTIIGTLQSIAWMLLIFFIVTLIAYVIVRGQELKHGSIKKD
ncbi:MAG: hypothetical protein ACM3SM_01950 [Bacteroidota bacterium]